MPISPEYHSKSGKAIIAFQEQAVLFLLVKHFFIILYNANSAYLSM